MEDVTFFRKYKRGKLRQLIRAASDSNTMTSDSKKLRIKNNNNGWKNVCINQEENGDSYHCACRALGRRNIHICASSITSTAAQNI